MSHRSLDGVSFIVRTGVLEKEELYQDGSKRLYIVDANQSEFVTTTAELAARPGHRISVVIAKSPPQVTDDEWHLGYYNHDLNTWTVPSVRLSNYIQLFRTSNGCLASILSFALGLGALGAGFAAFTDRFPGGALVGIGLVVFAVYLMLFRPLSLSAGINGKSKAMTEEIPRRARAALDEHLKEA